MKGLWEHSMRWERKHVLIEQLSAEKISKELQQHLAPQNETTADGLQLKTMVQSLWSAPKIKVQVQKKTRDSFSVELVYRTIDVLVVGLILGVLIAMLGRFHNLLFFAIAFVAAVLYVAGHNLWLWSRVERLFGSFPLYKRFSNEELLREQQMSWEQTDGSCPACGVLVSNYHGFCPSCSLLVNSNPNKYPVSTSKFASKGIVYSVRKRKDLL